MSRRIAGRLAPSEFVGSNPCRTTGRITAWRSCTPCREIVGHRRRRRSDEELDRIYGKLDAPLVVYGHVHHPFVRQLPEFVVANSGSVGLPYDGDPRASYLVIDDGRPTIRRIAYDVDAEIKEIASSGYPHMPWISAMLRTGRFVPP